MPRRHMDPESLMYWRHSDSLWQTGTAVAITRQRHLAMSVAQHAVNLSALPNPPITAAVTAAIPGDPGHCRSHGRCLQLAPHSGCGQPRPTASHRRDRRRPWQEVSGSGGRFRVRDAIHAAACGLAARAALPGAHRRPQLVLTAAGGADAEVGRPRTGRTGCLYTGAGLRRCRNNGSRRQQRRGMVEGGGGRRRAEAMPKPSLVGGPIEVTLQIGPGATDWHVADRDRTCVVRPVTSGFGVSDLRHRATGPRHGTAPRGGFDQAATGDSATCL